MVTTRRVLAHIRSQLSAGNYTPAGNCFEAALAAGILLAVEPESVVRLVHGEVRHRPHWWLLVGKEIVDPTDDQFDPVPGPEEYTVTYQHPIDLTEIAWLLRKNAPVTEPGSS
jgi:hypothetical protein